MLLLLLSVLLLLHASLLLLKGTQRGDDAFSHSSETQQEILLSQRRVSFNTNGVVNQVAIHFPSIGVPVFHKFSIDQRELLSREKILSPRQV